jgi:hypothetical protein
MSHDDPLDLEKHRSLIERIVGHYIDAQVLIVPSIGGWLAANGDTPESAVADRDRMGKSFWNSPSAPNLILLQTPLTQDRVIEYLTYLHLRRFRRVNLLEGSLDCLKHLVLHEVAHIKHNWRQDREKDCDRWAFDQLRWWA